MQPRDSATRGRAITIGATLLLAVLIAVSLGLVIRQRLLDEALVREMTVSPYSRNPDRQRIMRLVRSGSSPNVDMKTGMTPLDYAVTTDDLPLIRELLDRGANPNRRTARDQVALMHVKSATASELLLSRGADPAFRHEIFDQPVPSFIINGTGSLEALKPLLKRGVDINSTNSRGETGLMGLARSGRLKRVEMLLKMGADPAVRDINGRTAADHVRRQLHRETSPPARERLLSTLRLLRGVQHRK